MKARTNASTLEESAIVERVARIVFSVRGKKPDYTRLAAELEQAIPFDIFGVVLLRHDRQAVRVTVCQREADSWIALHHQHPLQGSKLEQMLLKPDLVVTNYPEGLDGPPATSGDALSGSHQLHSTLIAPLMIEERVLGTLELGSTNTNIYADPTLQRLISAVVRVLATAIESAQLGGSAAIQDRQRQALQKVTHALATKLDLPTILNQIVDGIANTLNVASAILMFDRRGNRLRLEAHAGLNAWALERILENGKWLSSKCIVGWTLQHRLPAISQNVAGDERFPESRSFFTELGVRSLFCYPLVTGTTVYGVLILGSPEPGGFTPLKSDILSLFASQATIAIQNGLLLESAHRRSRFQEAIEQLEDAHRRTASVDTKGSNGVKGITESEGEEQQLREELAMLARVREETQRTFGVSFTSLLRFISDHLLTQNERDLQAILYAEQRRQVVEARDGSSDGSFDERSSVREQLPVGQQHGYIDTISLLTQTAEAALLRTGMVSELSRLIMQLKQSTNGVKDAWFVVDLNGICMYMNPAAEALCEVRLEEMVGSYTQLFAALGDQGSAQTIEHAFTKLFPRIRNIEEVRSYLQDFSQGNTARQEIRCVVSIEPIPARSTEQQEQPVSSIEGAPSDYHYQFIRYPLQDQEGQFVAHFLQVRDVTEQVRDEKNRTVLLSAVSHDLRTPLTTIKAAVTGLLQSDVAWDEQDRQAMLEDIDCETDHLTDLVNALVELSRIEMGALVLQKEWCDIVEIIDGTLTKMDRVLAGRVVDVRLLSHMPLVYADHAQLGRVFYNLLENAAGRSPEHSEIIVTLETGEHMLLVKVVDHGSGIPDHERERIFKSFYSLRSYGNGLGLAICKGLIEAHGGRIWVEAVEQDFAAAVTATKPVTGACFVFSLPLNPDSVASASRATISSIGGWQISTSMIASRQTHEPVRGESNESEK